MILHLAMLAITFADTPPAPDFVEFSIREGISAEDRWMVESILNQRRRTFDRLADEAAYLQALIPRIHSGRVLPGVNPFQRPAPAANGDWYFADENRKAVTESAFNARLRLVRQRLKKYAVDPTFATAFVGRPEIGTIGHLPQPMSVTHVVSDIEVLLDGPIGKVRIEGIDARDIADNQPLSLPWAFFVAGTTSYIDGYGALRTVPRLRRFDLDRFIERVEP
jgi:hypothetical protein